MNPSEDNNVIFSYRLKTDAGVAPNVQNEILSLCLCKPVMRKSIKHLHEKGKTVFLIGSGVTHMRKGTIKNIHNIGDRTNHIIFIAKIDQILTFAEYYEIFKNRKDCIYKPTNKKGKDSRILYKQFDHTYHDEGHTEHDTKNDIVLLSEDFIYFGDKSIKANKTISSFLPKNSGRGHRVYDLEHTSRRKRQNKVISGDNNNIKHVPEYFSRLKETYGEIKIVGKPHIIISDSKNCKSGQCGTQRQISVSDCSIKNKKGNPNKKAKLC